LLCNLAQLVANAPKVAEQAHYLTDLRLLFLKHSLVQHLPFIGHVLPAVEKSACWNIVTGFAMLLLQPKTETES
jgi:hypothetical protein